MALGVDSFSGFVQKGFAHAAFTTAEGMKDDEQVRQAARNIYDYIPFPANVAIKMSVGMEGMERFALVFRDRLLAANITDFTKISPEDLRALMRKSLLSVPSLSRFMTAKEQEGPSGLQNIQPANTALPTNTVLSVNAHDNPHDTDKPALDSPAPTTQPAEAKEWYLFRDETRYGPWSDKEFLSFVEQGQLQLNDMVWREGFADWIGVRELPELLATKKTAAPDYSTGP